MKSLSRVRLFATPWTVAHQAPPSMGFSRQEYWSALPFPSPRDLLDPGIEPRSPALQADALTSKPPGKTSIPKKGNAKECSDYHTIVETSLEKLSIFNKPFPGSSEVKVSACNAGDLGSIPGLGRSPGDGNGNPLQYPGLENSMDRGD